MQLLTVGLARSVWLFDINELNPSGKSIFPDAFLWAADRYSFESFPKTIGDLDATSKGFLFKHGKFQAAEGSVSVNLSMFSDGFVAETWSSTEKSDAFMEDLLRSAGTQYGLAKPYMIRKQYVSEITVRFDNPLSKLSPMAMEFCKTLDHFFQKQNLPQFELSGIGFSLDASRNSYKPPAFIVERKIGVDFSQNSYWSKAPFPTKDHLAALEKFEQMLRGD